MTRASIQPASAGDAAGVRRIGCVSFLNALPLIVGLEQTRDVAVTYDVPSGLLPDLEAGDVDIALCPVIDFQRAATPLQIVPVGGIGCDGKTLTVRLYSQQPFDQLQTIHADTDSHTSVALLQIILHEQFARRPQIVDYNAREKVAAGRPLPWPQAMLLIGDKVVTDSPPAVRYPHQLDLGEAWKRLTGLPFVFAVWMCRAGENLGDTPAALDAVRRRNADRIDDLVAGHAPAHHWPLDLARRYLGQWLKYDIGPPQLQAIELFHRKARRLGLCAAQRPIDLYER